MEKPEVPEESTAQKILLAASNSIKDRAASRDDEQTAERSMGKTIDAMNAIFGLEMTEVQGWLFMTMLKIARSSKGKLTIDDYVDGAAYFALAGEAAILEMVRNSPDDRKDVAMAAE